MRASPRARGVGLALLLGAALSSGTSALAQDPVPAPQAQPPQERPAQAPAPPDLPVSLQRIREQLNRGDTSILLGLDRRPDFVVQIEEQARIDALLAQIDFSSISGPTPAGGLTTFEIQRQLFRSTRPLQQPYAAFNGGQLLTIALQNLIGRYVGGRVARGVGSAMRTRAEQDAREEVDETIAAYCAARPDRDRIHLCTSTPER